MDQSCRESQRYRTQFSLKDLFEYMTICCVLAALSSFTGLGSAFCLMAFTLALAGRQGQVAMATLVAASVAAEMPINEDGTKSALHQFTVLFIAGSLGAWYCCRRHAQDMRASVHAIFPCRRLAPDDFGNMRLPDRFE